MLVAGSVLLIFFVFNFLGLCTWAVCNIPKWSLTHMNRVTACSFLVNRYSMYMWWYGVPDLARNTLLSLCPVLATSFPPAQAALLTIVIAAYLLMHMRFLPWKMPVVNLLQGWFLSMLLFQVTITATFSDTSGSSSFASDVENFNQGVSFVVLASSAFVLGCVSLVVGVAFLYVLVAGTQGSVEVLLHLGRKPKAQELVEKMKQVAQELLDIDADQAQRGLNHLHPADLTRISNSIDMIATDLLGTTRRNQVSLNRVITFNSVHQKVRASVQRNTMPDPAMAVHEVQDCNDVASCVSTPKKDSELNDPDVFEDILQEHAHPDTTIASL